MTVGVTAAAGAAYSDTATVSGTESGATVGGTATTTANASPDLPPGFVQTQLVGGLNKPIVVVPAPNGDIYIGEQGGTILDYHNGALLPTPVLTLNVFQRGGDRTARDWRSTRTSPPTGTSTSPTPSPSPSPGWSSPTPGCRASPWSTASPARPARRSITRATRSRTRTAPEETTTIRATTVKIGPDGKLWWSVGDNVPSISNGQALSTTSTARSSGSTWTASVPSDNPFVNVPGAVPYIYAYGLRNPWRFTFLPNGKAMTEDTGSSYWEDLDTLQPGSNFGWPIKEGNCGSCGYANPAYSYGHYPTDAAASAIAAYSGSTFPKAYDNVVFFGDYNRQDIEAVTFDPTYQTEVSDTVFDSNAGTIADLEEGPDGNLYLANVFGGTRLRNLGPGPFPPTAVGGSDAERRERRP